MVDSDLKISLKIREIREKRKESGIDVALVLGISPQYYYDLEKGKRNLSTEIATKLANHFSVSVDYLLGRTDGEDKGNDKALTLHEEPAVYGEYLDRPEIRDLVNALKDATKEDVEKTIKIIEALKGK